MRMYNPGHILKHPCPECGGELILRNSKYGLFYGCANYPKCDGSHGAHKKTGEPLGIPADKPTKQSRIEAHNLFDKLWNGPEATMRRKEAYKWLARTMDLDKDNAHISKFSKEQCDKLIKILTKELKT
ncbi:MAG: hypothetical protein GF411_14760 [Candidatus Lokiarchaeota archaeon]|nr:hypothetical protein [Candidatus Lokiarchaeota archaeon]